MKHDPSLPTRVVFALLLSIGCNFFLLGLLTVDVTFDFIPDTAAVVSYYCSLSNSFKSALGISRILIPVFLSGNALIYLSLKVPVPILKRQGQLVTCLMSVVGLPSLVVSILSCKRDCDQYQEIRSLDLVRTIHAVMGCLLVFSVCAQANILSKMLLLVTSE